MSDTKQPAFMTPRGVIRCAHCRTDDYGLPEGPRLGDHHVSTRFGDAGRVQVLFEGEDVTKDAFEAVGGRNGAVYLHDKNTAGFRYPCPTGADHTVIVKHTGRVDVVRLPGS